MTSKPSSSSSHNTEADQVEQPLVSKNIQGQYQQVLGPGMYGDLLQGVQYPTGCILPTRTPPGDLPPPPTPSPWDPSTSLARYTSRHRNPTASSPPQGAPATPRTSGVRWQTTPGDTDPSDSFRPTRYFVI